MNGHHTAASHLTRGAGTASTAGLLGVPAAAAAVVTVAAAAGTAALAGGAGAEDVAATGGIATLESVDLRARGLLSAPSSSGRALQVAHGCNLKDAVDVGCQPR